MAPVTPNVTLPRTKHATSCARASTRSRPRASASCSSSPTARARCRCRRCSTLFREHLAARAKALDFLIALGTHQPMDDAALSAHSGRARRRRRCRHVAHVQPRLGPTRDVRDHRHDHRHEIAELSGGRLSQDVTVSLNRLHLRLRSRRHLRPGVSARSRRLLRRQQVLLSRHRGRRCHQLHALARRAHHQLRVIGSGYTPVRAVIDRAASMVTVPTSCFALVVTKDGIAGLLFRRSRATCGSKRRRCRPSATSSGSTSR